jgi:uncharacterized protein YecE (DUF72 family)
MSFLPGFGPAADTPPQAARLAPKLESLAERGIYFGTSSWKYEGWLGTIYSPEKYSTRGKFSRTKFETDCLAEYAATFPVVCGDFAFYQFPTPQYWERLFDGTPATFQFAFKVPEDITVPRWPKHPRYGTRGGKDNEAFLNAGLFHSLFARRLEPYANRVATLIFEFGTLAKSMFPTPDDFLERLEPFLAALPKGFRYSVEIRNPEYLVPGYFGVLVSQGVAHVFNAWTRMPELTAQIEMPGAFTTDFTVVRALLAKGRSFEKAVESFQPYRLIQETNEPGRDAMVAIAKRTLTTPKQRAYFFVNNRYEGNAPTTIEAVVEVLEAWAEREGAGVEKPASA